MVRVFILLLLPGAAWATCPIESHYSDSTQTVWYVSAIMASNQGLVPSNQLCSYYFCGDYTPGITYTQSTQAPPSDQLSIDFQNLESVHGCWAVTTTIAMTVTLTGNSKDDLIANNDLEYPTYSINCNYIYCSGIKTCIEGQYATDYVQLDPYGFAVNVVDCIACAPGTFNTCLTCEPESEKCTCQWNIPTGQYDSYTPANIVVVAGQLPVKSCYSCELISPGFNWYFHANDTDHSLRSVVRSDNHYCPGNLYGQSGIPRDCPSNQVHSDDWTRCVCPPGFYSTNPTDQNVSCTACLIGHFCINNGMTLCPDHQYQDQTQATACLNCANPASASGVPVGTCPTNSLPRQCVGLNPAYHSSPSNCVPCNACQRPYVENIAGQVPCYLT